MSLKIKIKTLTLIHIGSGRIIGPFELKVIGNHLYRLDVDKCFRFVLDRIGNEGIVELDKWANEKSYEIDPFGQSRKHIDYKIDVFDFIENFLKNKQLSEELKQKIINESDFYLYRYKSYQTPSKNISEIIKTANNELYIPGSSIKGVIRTALLSQYVYDELNWDWLLTIIKKINNKIKNLKEIKNRDKIIDNEILNHIFKCGCECEIYKNGKNKIVKYDDEKYDLMKFIKITDTNSIKFEHSGCLIQPKLYLVNGKEQGQLNLYEVIDKNQEFEARISVELDYLLALKSQLPYIKDSKGNKIWIDLEGKFEKLFGIPLSDLRKENKYDFEEKMIEQLKNAVENTSISELNKESIIPNRKIDSFYENLPENAIKIGWASQFYGTTLLEVLTCKESENKSEQFTEVKNVYLNILNSFKTGRTDIKDSDDFPKSRRYNDINQNTMEALGWVEMNIERI